jgi:GNAT superfamily N-acetyltransferase
MLPDGYSALPPGKIASVVVYLEMTDCPPAHPRSRRTDLELHRLGRDDGARYRAIFRAVGERWLWFSRLASGDADLVAILGDPDVEAYEVRLRGDPIGLLELDFRALPDCELAFFGLVESAIGSGAGRALMDEALRKAWSRPIARLWVHTCHLDHPGAIAFYRRSGFRPYAHAIEIADDPRLTGVLPRTAGPHWPAIA